jgi:hypothetical protein
LEHLGSKNDALKVYEAGLADPGVKGAQRVALQKSVVKLSIPPRRWKVPVFAELSTPVKERRLLADRHTACAVYVATLGRAWVLCKPGVGCRMRHMLWLSVFGFECIAILMQ